MFSDISITVTINNVIIIIITLAEGNLFVLDFCSTRTIFFEQNIYYL